jgi:hypothetical protein
MFDFDFEYNDSIMSILSVVMICYVLYTVYNLYMNEQEIFPSPFEAISNMTGLGDNTEVIKHHIAPEDDTDSETENDITKSSLDNLDSVLEQLPSQIKKNIDYSIEKNNDDLVVIDDSFEKNDKMAETVDTGEQDENESDENESNESGQEISDVAYNKLDGNNKLRMRKIDLIKKKKINEQM